MKPYNKVVWLDKKKWGKVMKLWGLRTYIYRGFVDQTENTKAIYTLQCEGQLV